MYFRSVKWLLLLAVFATFPSVDRAQSPRQLTTREFSRFNVLTRASYFEQAMLNAAKAEGVDPKVLWTIAYNETRFRPWLTSNKGAKGLMQFIPATAARFDLRDPYDPVTSIKAAARYVKYLSGMFGGRLDSVLAAYNAGEGTVLAYLSGRPLRTGSKIINAGGRTTIGGVPPYTETTGYVGRGIKVYRWLETRGKFPINEVRVNFPGVISASVDRVSLIDPELGTTQVIKPMAASKILVSPTSLAATTLDLDPLREKEKEVPSQKGLEVFYDPRSGRRLLYYPDNDTGKTMSKVLETGPIIVTNETRTGVTSRARTTFAGMLGTK
ncbi:MAG: lytic transglycosylase domain-containing protein [Pyrinomonadaceae bacterium]